MKTVGKLTFIIALVWLNANCARETARFQQAVLPKNMAKAAPHIDMRHALTIDQERVALTKAYFEAHNQALFKKMPQTNDQKAIEFVPRIVVVHYTAIDSLEKTAAYFAPNTIAGNRGVVTQSGALNVGIQFMVDRDGTIYQSYPDNVMSRHVIGLNHVAIGIENIGNADLDAPAKEGVVPLTPEQLMANADLIRFLRHKYPSLEFMIAHYEYRDLENPKHPAHDLFAEDQPEYRTDKVDPGKRFMKALRKELSKP